MTASRTLSPALARTYQSLCGNNTSEQAGISSDYFPLPDAPAVRRLALSAMHRGQLTRAGRLLWDLVAGDPDDQEMRLALVSVMLQRDQPIDALALLDEELVRWPDNARATERKAFILALLGRLDESLMIYGELVAALPEIPQLLVARGNLLVASGCQQLAINDYRAAISLDAGYGEPWWALANIKTYQLSDADIRSMTSLLERRQLDRASRINIEFALGKAFEDAGLPNRSIAHYRAANELQSVGDFNVREMTHRHVDQAIDCFGSALINERLGHPSSAPIFIIGMPRSGTTLVEQILASHPDIEGTSELPTISAIARALGEGVSRSEFEYSSLLVGYTDEALKKLGDRYLEQSAAYRRTDRPFFIDKMPSNWMHVGLIRLILPNARIVEVRRDPMDCCFSNFAQNFPRGHEFTHSLESLGAHYRDYERLMDHFDVAAPGAVIRISYEQLVERPEETIRDLLDRLGLPFESSCLRFFENDRPVRTPSAQQVRQPLNRQGIGRSHPYKQWLQPLIRSLARD